MRKIFYCAIIARIVACYAMCSFLISGVNGQVYNGSLTLESQQQIDAFNYTSVTGDLIIQEVAAGNITNFNGLSELTSIGGDLTIGYGLNGNTALTNLDGLSNLTSVGWAVSISRNSALQNIGGLSKLISIAQSLSIYNNSVLSNLDGLLGIRTLQSLYIENNPISNINGLSNLTSVAYNVSIKGNNGLKNLNGLANLNFVGGSLNILNNSQLTDFCGLYTLWSNSGCICSYPSFFSGNGAPLNVCSTLSGNLTLTTQEQIDKCNFTSITGNLLIHENASGNITNLSGLADLTSLGGSLTIQNNTALTSYCGLYPLFNGGYAGSYSITGNAVNPTSAQIISGGTCPIYVGDITLTTQAQVDAFHYTGVTGNLSIQQATPGAITNLNALSSLTFVGGDFGIGGAAITNVDALSNLTSVGGELTIGNPTLTSIDGLSHVTSLGGLFIGGGNSSLTNINGLSHVETVKQSIYINYTLLTNLDGFSGLTSAGHIDITGNSALTNINGLSHLKTMKGLEGTIPEFGLGLLIKRNRLLTNLDGLSGLESINGSLEIEFDSALINIDGLHNLKTITKRLDIFSNPLLENIDGVSNLQSFYPDHTTRNILIVDNDGLKNINGLKNVQFLWQSLSISDNASLENIDGLSHLNSALNINISTNKILTNLNGLSNMTASSVSIIGNQALSSFCGLFYALTNNPAITLQVFGNLVNPTAPQIISGGACSVIPPDFILTSQAEVDAFDYSFVPANLAVVEDVAGNITNLNHLSQLIGVAGSFSILKNSNLQNFNGLSNLTDIGFDLDVENNPLLNNIDALSNLTSVSSVKIGGTLLTNLNGLSHLTGPVNNIEISGNTVLTSISALSGLQNAPVIGITSNDLLTTLDGLQGATAPKSIVITGNNSLADLNGLNNVTSVKYAISIHNNAALINLDGLSALTLIDAPSNTLIPSLRITNNVSLTNLDGLSHLLTAKGNLFVAGNTVLNKFCGLYNLLSGNGLGGTYDVFNNAVNPTIQQIIDGGACSSSSSPVTVTINQASAQTDPTSTSPIHFTVTFSENVTGFTGSDIAFTGSTVNGTLIAAVTGGPTAYDVAVSGMTSGGTVIASIPAGVALNSLSQSNLASTSTDNTVTFIFNHCPVAGTLNLYTPTGMAINTQLIGTDADNDVLTFSISQNPAHGIATTSSTGSAVYTPFAGYQGNDQFKYKVTDGKCDAEGTVNITMVVCPKGVGYWKTHPEAWPSSALPMLLGTRSYTKAQLLTILNMTIGNGGNADASLLMADQEIAAKLNLAAGSPVVDGLNDSLFSADRLIGNNAIPMKIKPNSPLGKRMIAVAVFLASYNNGDLTQGCHAEVPLTSSKQINSSGEAQSIVTNNLEVKVYPNPASNHFNVMINSNDAIEKIVLQVFDQYGRSIETRTNISIGSAIHIGDRYKSGVYYIRVLQGTQHAEIKLIKIN